MELPENIVQFIQIASAKALATCVNGSANVVPVSKIKVVDNKIWLVNYFMGKTIENIRQNSTVSLACWQGLEGYQIKGEVEYLTEGEIFSSVATEAATEYPDRTVQGVLVLTAKELFDVSATADKPGKKLI